MSRIADRLKMIGFVFLLGACVYYLANVKSKTWLELEELNISAANTRVIFGKEGEIEHRSAKQIQDQKLERAYWPAGTGVLFLLVGLALSGTRTKDAQDS